MSRKSRSEAPAPPERESNLILDVRAALLHAKFSLSENFVDGNVRGESTVTLFSLAGRRPVRATPGRKHPRPRHAHRQAAAGEALPATLPPVKYMCESCGFIYDPAEGDPDGGIPPGTQFEDIPETWFCPVCGARKRDFTPYED